MKKIAVFCSGSGSDFQSIIDANEKERFCQIALMLASKEGIGAIERAKKHGIPFFVVPRSAFDVAEEMCRAIDKILTENEIDYIVLAGYLSILTKEFTDRYRHRIINIHPSLIPSFCGKGYYGLNVHRAAIDYGVKLSGATVHFVNGEPDGGEIIMQRAVEIDDNDTAETLQQKILKIEHEMLPKAVRLLVEGRLKVEGRRVKITEEL